MVAPFESPKENRQLDGEDSAVEDQPYLDQARLLAVMAIFRLRLPPLNKLTRTGALNEGHKAADS